MLLQQINVEGFGTLSQCRLTGLDQGLNVIYGVNGAGKTTLLHFLSGIFSGFHRARQLRLLPPLKQGTPGGSMTVKTRAGRFDIIRHARADNSDTLAISLLQGTADDVAALRQTLKEIPEQWISRFYAVTGAVTHDLAGLVNFAREEGIELDAPSGAGAWLTTKVREMEAERAEFFRTAPNEGTLAQLELQRSQLAEELASTRKTQLQQLTAWQHSLKHLREKIDALTAQGLWQDGELQAVETDLTETQDRLWSTRQVTIQDVETQPRPQAPATSDWGHKVEALDREIAHIQQVLRDLATSRMTLSVSKAELVGAEIPEVETLLQRQRQSLSVIEFQTDQFNQLLEQLGQASACQCSTLGQRLHTGIEAIREQVWLICQELGRQHTAHQQSLLQSQREGVDRCEHELVRQIQRLRLRRDELMHAHSRHPMDRVHFRHAHEAAGCLCHGHEEAHAGWTVTEETAPVAMQVIVRERAVTLSNARPEDPQTESALLARRSQLRGDRDVTTAELRLARMELQQLEAGARDFAGDSSAQLLQNEFALVEQQLADAREQWQSLTLLQTVLHRTQQKLNQESISPVIAEASRYLHRMTAGRYPRLRWNAKSSELLVINAAHAELPWQALSRGTLEQTALCLRLALCHEFQRRGHDIPLILDDVLTDSDEDRLLRAVDVLVEFAVTHQVLFLTCQEHLADVFAARQATVLSLPGSERAARPIAVATPTETAPMPALRVTLDNTAISADAEIEELDVLEARVQPEDPYWLHPASAVGQLPSLGEQMSRRLGALGVRTIGELVDLDPEQVEMPLDSLQISAATLRGWQAEARLLCCVPQLTGRDAQLLVLCGIQSPAELAECDANMIFSRISAVRARHSGDYQSQWLLQRPEWPSRNQVEHWIRAARQGRSWRASREWAHSRQQSQPAQPRRRVLPAAELTPQVRLHSHSDIDAADAGWKFYLRLDSPIVDAPSIGPKMAERLKPLGIDRVSQLLSQHHADIAHRLNRRDVSSETVLAWQQQASLMCRVPQLRGHDAQVLVSCQITEPEALAELSPAELFARVEPFVNSREGSRLLRSARVPDLAEVTDWIQFARQSPMLRAA